MSLENFLSFLQQILTMVEPMDKASVTLAKNALSAVVNLAKASEKVDAITLRSMRIAERDFEYLVRYKDNFAGVPGEYQNNNAKRQRLSHMLRPGC